MRGSIFSKSARRTGFTLLELMVTVGIIGILTALVMVTLTEQRRAGRDANRQLSLSEYTTSLQQYYSQSHTYMLSPAPCFISNTAELYPGVTDPTLKLPIGSGDGCVGFKKGGWGSINRKNGSQITNYGLISIADALRQGGFLQRTNTDPRTAGQFPTQPASDFKASDGSVTEFDDFILTLCNNDGKPAATAQQATEFGLFAQLERDPQITHPHDPPSKQECGGPGTGYGWDTIQ